MLMFSFSVNFSVVGKPPGGGGGVDQISSVSDIHSCARHGIVHGPQCTVHAHHGIVHADQCLGHTRKCTNALRMNTNPSRMFMQAGKLITC